MGTSRNHPSRDGLSSHELSSLSTSLDDCVRRLESIRSTAAQTGDEEAALELEEVCRTLRGAARRLGQLVKTRLDSVEG